MRPADDRARRRAAFETQPFRRVDAAVDAVIPGVPESWQPDHRGPRFLAVVHTARDVCFRATAHRREELIQQLAQYASDRVGHQLWLRDATRVRTLLARGELEAAIACYFAAVGQRWDKEWLVTIAMEAAGA